MNTDMSYFFQKWMIVGDGGRGGVGWGGELEQLGLLDSFAAL